MNVVLNQPTNLNYLNPTGLTFSVKRLPSVSFFAQRSAIPGVTLPTATYFTSLENIPLGGAKLEYDDLTVQFIVDEDMTNYIEIFSWLKGLGAPESGDQFAALIAKGLTSQASLFVLDAKKNPNFEMIFTDAFPINIGSVMLDTTVTDIEYAVCNVTFKYTNFDIRRVKAGAEWQTPI